MSDFVRPIVDIISRLWACCARHTRYLCELQENKSLLRNALKELTEVKDDVQRRVDEDEADPNEPKKRTDQVCGWLQRVQITEGEVEEILKKADEQLSRGRCLGGCCPPSNKCWGNYKLGKSIAKKIPLVDELKMKGCFEEVTYNLPPPSVQNMNLESTVGMESMFDKVWRLLKTSTATNDKVVRIMGLYGHGGVGKTTLLKKINNEFNKISGEQGFDYIVMFVLVSKPTNYEAIQKTIGKRLGLSEDGDESSRAHKIFNQLRNRNFVILLDDIWERVDLQRIGIPSSPPQGMWSSSKVIFTTRNKQVCGLMEATHTFQVACLPWDKAWRLFKDKVGEDTLSSISRQGAGELAKDVAKECGGLPLALITIGRAMSTKKSVEEWKYALRTLRNSASEFQGMSDDILPRLKLSYDNLRNETIKSCFLYCALYPEDHCIKIAKLIDFWIAEGILNRTDNNLDEARSHGHHVIETLKRACLLEESEDRFSRETYVKMHDIIRDLALWIVNECNSSGKTTGKFLVASNVDERWRNAQRIFWMSTHTSSSNNKLELEEPPTSPNLQTLIVKRTYYYKSLPQSFFQLTPFLRVLDLSNTQLTELPTSIGELSDLQYLSLRNTNIKELPIELRKLVKLKFLDLSYTRVLRKIPAGVIANLSELQVLKLVGSGFKDLGLKEEEEDGGGFSFGELDRLKQLQELGITINTSLGLEKLLLCNQKIRMVCTDLHLDIKSISLPPPSSISEGLVNLASLQYLNISSSSVELEELTSFIIIGAAGLLKNNIVYHVVSPFQNLYTISIDHCNALKDLRWLVYVENLKKLDLAYCKGLETIIDLGDDGLEGGAGGGGDQMLNTRGGGGFRRLKTLSMCYLPRLKSICRHALAFPSIETITVYGCQELKKLPLGSGSNVENTLKWIACESEWWNTLQWEDETIKFKFLPYLNKRDIVRRCFACDTTSTPLWRNGPKGPKSLCNACGIRYKKDRRIMDMVGTDGGQHGEVAYRSNRF